VKRALLCVVLAACSSRKGSPPPPPAPVVKADAAVARPPSPPIDLPEAGVAALQVVPVAGAAKGMLDVRWRAATIYPVGMVCRIEVYNLACTQWGSGGGTLDRAFRYTPEPFVLEPHVCEIRFLAGHAPDAPVRVAARACYHDGTLMAGACATGTFPPPKLPAGMAIDVQGASVHVRPGSRLELKALLTVAEPIEPVKFDVSCDGNTNVDDGYGYVPVEKLSAGETLFGSTAFQMKQPVAADPKQCELHVVAKGKTLGTFCLSEGSTEPGPCAAK